MATDKADTQLNLALSVPENILVESPELSTGYIATDNKWEVIVNYVGSLDRVREELDVQITELLNEYAIIVIRESEIDALASFDEIIFMEKPKILEFQVMNGISASCLTTVQQPPYNLSGQGVIVSIIDTGIDYSHPDFRNPDGTSRILYLWDQTIEGNPPEGYIRGTLYTKEQIDQALQATTRQERDQIVPSTDVNGHGTHVAGICCGNGRASNGRYRGVAYNADMIVVKLGRSIGNSFPSTAQLMAGIDFSIKKAIEVGEPLVINISFGNSYGSHTGESLLESFIDAAASVGRNNIVIGTGNEGDTGRHKEGKLGMETEQVRIEIGPNETDFNLQIWKNPFDLIDVYVIAPNGTRIGPLNRRGGTQQFELAGSRIYSYFGEPSPYTVYTEIFIAWIPKDRYVESGEWIIELNPISTVVGSYFMWLPAGNALNRQSKFLRPSVETTLTIPSTAIKTIAVGAYNSNDDSLAPFSGRGFTVNDRIKPDLVAPGVGITSSSPGGGYSANTGTSFAAPFVTGACALLMQWGIVEKNDPYMYGEKTKAALLITARHLEAFTIYPNEAIGFGALCLRFVE